jgi:hypothetical protein
MENDSSFSIEEAAELLDLSSWIDDVSSKDRPQYLSEYGKQLENENAIWLHDHWGAFGNWVEFVKIIDTLVLLYDKVFWYYPFPHMVIRDAWKHRLAENPSLREAGVDESFPERFMEFVERGAIVPFGPYHGPPVEDQFELDLVRYRIHCMGSYGAIDPKEEFPIFHSFLEAVLYEKRKSNRLWDYHRSEYLLYYILDLALMPKIFGSKSILLTQKGISDSLNISTDILLKKCLPANGLNLTPDMRFIEQTGCFFENIILASPHRLTIDEIWSFRESRTATDLRAWLTDTYKRSEDRLVSLPPSTYLVSEFNELAESYIDKPNTWLQEVTIAASFATLGAIFGGIPGAITGSVGSIAGQNGLKYLINYWKQQSNPMKWILGVHQLKNRVKNRKYVSIQERMNI